MNIFPHSIYGEKGVNALNVDLESLHKILKHPIRRKIVLKLDEKRELAYIDLMNLLEVENTDITIHKSRVCVVGQGTIGFLVTRTMVALGAETHVAARNPVQRAAAYAAGAQSHPLEELSALAPTLDTIISTVPAQIVSRDVLTRLPPHALLVDLAAPPGGIDREAANELGLKFVWARGMGSRAPRGRELVLGGGRVNVVGQPLYSTPEAPVFDRTVRWANPVIVTKNARLSCVRAGADKGTVWTLTAQDAASGARLWEQPLPAEPVRWGVAVDARGRTIVTLRNGQILCFGSTPTRAAR